MFFRHFYSSVEFILHIFGWFFIQQGEYNDCDYCQNECRQQFIDGKHTAEVADNQFPQEYHTAAAEHARNGTPAVGALPEEREENQGPKGGAEARPGKGDDREDDAILVKSDERGEDVLQTRGCMEELIR